MRKRDREIEIESTRLKEQKTRPRDAKTDWREAETRDKRETNSGKAEPETSGNILNGIQRDPESEDEEKGNP